MLLQILARWLARYITAPRHVHNTSSAPRIALLQGALRPADVLLVEGYSHVSTAIKYLTQSTWSHAAIFVGDVFGKVDSAGMPLCFVEADVTDGVRAVSAETYQGLHCRICRPVGLNHLDIERIVAFVISQVGHRYDLKNVFDLCRYLIPTPPVFSGWRRRMISLGSGDPTRAICSTMIAQAFGVVNYPILPIVSHVAAATDECPDCINEILHVRHYSLYVPRDFDVSPYFQVVKPTLEDGFDFHALSWAANPSSERKDPTAHI